MVSLFIPVYNGERYLSATLDSVLAQTYGEWEALCVDDSSTDGSWALLQTYAAQNNRIRVFQKPNGGSVPPSWKYIMPHIHGEFILYMSQDDLLQPDSLKQLVQRQQETGADAVIPHEIHYHAGLPDEQQHHLKGINGDTTPVISGQEAFRLMIDYSISGRALWRSDIIRNVGISTDTFNADELAQRQWALACDKVAFSDAVFLYCRDNPEAITTKHSPRHYDSCLTNAQLLQLASRVFPDDLTLLTRMANGYYEYLLKMELLYSQHKKEYTPKERQRAVSMMRRAYIILHRRHSLKGKKNRITSINYFALQTVIRFKTFLYNRQGLRLEDNFDATI